MLLDVMRYIKETLKSAVALKYIIPRICMLLDVMRCIKETLKSVDALKRSKSSARPFVLHSLYAGCADWYESMLRIVLMSAREVLMSAREQRACELTRTLYDYGAQMNRHVLYATTVCRSEICACQQPLLTHHITDRVVMEHAAGLAPRRPRRRRQRRGGLGASPAATPSCGAHDFSTPRSGESTDRKRGLGGHRQRTQQRARAHGRH